MFGGNAMIITVTLNPAQDKSVVIENFGFDKVNRITEMRLDAGGKGINVSKTIKALGGETLALGVLGGNIGNYIMSTMDRMDIRHDFVHLQTETRTNLKIYDPATKMYTDINEPGFELPAVRLKEVETKLFYYAKPGDFVVFAGGAPSGVPSDIFFNWTRRLQANGVSVICDLDGELLKSAVMARPFMIKPNLAEIMRLCGLRDTSIYTLVGAARKLVEGGIRTVVVSLGPDGALFVNKNEALYAKSPRVEAVSTVGAGDSMTAALVYSLTCNHRWRDAITLAMATATAKVMCEGNTPPPVELVNRYRSGVSVEQC